MRGEQREEGGKQREIDCVQSRAEGKYAAQGGKMKNF